MKIQPGDTVEFLYDSCYLHSTKNRFIQKGDHVVVHDVRGYLGVENKLLFSFFDGTAVEQWIFLFYVRKQVTHNQVEVKFR
jgi:hypothetical protein